MKTTFSLFALVLVVACSTNREEPEVVKSQKIDALNRPINNFPDTLNKDSSNFLYYTDRASICVERKQYNDAINFLNRGKYHTLDKANFYLKLAIVWQHIETKKAKDSLFYFLEKTIEIEPKNSYYYFVRSRFLNDWGYNTDALKDIEVAIKYSPSELGYVNQRGAYKMLLGDFKGAAADLKNLANGNKQNVDFLLAQCIIYNQLDMHREALKASTSLIALDSNKAQAYVVRGNALSHLNRKDESLKDFYKARDLGDTTAIKYIERHEKKIKAKQ